MLAKSGQSLRNSSPSVSIPSEIIESEAAFLSFVSRQMAVSLGFLCRNRSPTDRSDRRPERPWTSSNGKHPERQSSPIFSRLTKCEKSNVTTKQSLRNPSPNRTTCSIPAVISTLDLQRSSENTSSPKVTIGTLGSVTSLIVQSFGPPMGKWNFEVIVPSSPSGMAWMATYRVVAGS